MDPLAVDLLKPFKAAARRACTPRWMLEHLRDSAFIITERFPTESRPEVAIR